MAKKNNFMDGLRTHWDNTPTCSCINCVKYKEEKMEYLASTK